MTPYTRSKINEIRDIIKRISDRQKEIRIEMMKTEDADVKNILDVERAANSAAIRIYHWIRWTLEGRSLKYKLSIDKEFPRWMYVVRGYYIQDFLAGVLDLPEIEYKVPEPFYRWNAFNCYRYNSQRNLYGIIYTKLFKKSDGGGIFGFQNDDDIESDIWREYFKGLMEREWKEFKEMGLY